MDDHGARMVGTLLVSLSSGVVGFVLGWLTGIWS